MVLVTIVTWNSLPCIKFCLKSLAEQTYKDISIVVVDNGSQDGTVEELNVWRLNLYSRFNLFRLIQNTTNRGFAAAQNQGIACHSSKGGNPDPYSYILVLNPDAILTPTYLEEAVRMMEQNQQAGGITGQLLRYKMQGNKIITTNIIDSEGLEMLPWRQVRERNAGKRSLASCLEAKLLNIAPMPVWGISGACALYRLSALEEIKIPIIKKMMSEGVAHALRNERGVSPKKNGIAGVASMVSREAGRATPRYERQQRDCAAASQGRLTAVFRGDTQSEYFDEDFFCYKEDVDLAWRMRARGWNFLYTPHAVAFHQRGIGKEKPHRNRRVLINQWSYRNHLYVLLKNETLLDFFLHAPFILGYELAKFVYYLLVQPRTLMALWDVCRNLRYMLRKRNFIL